LPGRTKDQTYVPEMQRIISQILQLDMDAVSVKATTTEKWVLPGGEGLVAYASFASR
jgi:2-C-methyl-D-erythritol 2,4-cyclodiphosphate synthase